jgi:hypothetical protein
MASNNRLELASEIRAVSALAKRDMMRPPNNPKFRWAIRAEPWLKESGVRAAAVSGPAVAIPPQSMS